MVLSMFPAGEVLREIVLLPIKLPFSITTKCIKMCLYFPKSVASLLGRVCLQSFNIATNKNSKSSPPSPALLLTGKSNPNPEEIIKSNHEMYKLIARLKGGNENNVKKNGVSKNAATALSEGIKRTEATPAESEVLKLSDATVSNGERKQKRSTTVKRGSKMTGTSVSKRSVKSINGNAVEKSARIKSNKAAVMKSEGKESHENTGVKNREVPTVSIEKASENDKLVAVGNAEMGVVLIEENPVGMNKAEFIEVKGEEMNITAVMESEGVKMNVTTLVKGKGTQMNITTFVKKGSEINRSTNVYPEMCCHNVNKCCHASNLKPLDVVCTKDSNENSQNSDVDVSCHDTAVETLICGKLSHAAVLENEQNSANCLSDEDLQTPMPRLLTDGNNSEDISQIQKINRESDSNCVDTEKKLQCEITAAEESNKNELTTDSCHDKELKTIVQSESTDATDLQENLQLSNNAALQTVELADKSEGNKQTKNSCPNADVNQLVESEFTDQDSEISHTSEGSSETVPETLIPKKFVCATDSGVSHTSDEDCHGTEQEILKEKLSDAHESEEKSECSDIGTIESYKEELQKWSEENEKKINELYNFDASDKEIMKTLALTLKQLKLLKHKKAKLNSCLNEIMLNASNKDFITTKDLRIIMTNFKNVNAISSELEEKKANCLSIAKGSTKLGRIFSKVVLQNDVFYENYHVGLEQELPMSSLNKIQAILYKTRMDNVLLQKNISCTNEKLDEILKSSVQIKQGLNELKDKFFDLPELHAELLGMIRKFEEGKEQLELVQGERDFMREKLDILENLIQDQETFLNTRFEKDDLNSSDFVHLG